jgi:hypothetical protein
MRRTSSAPKGFGLCLPWQRKEELDEFIGIIQEYIDALVYPDPETGKMSIRLLRDDYVAADLPLFTLERPARHHRRRVVRFGRNFQRDDRSGLRPDHEDEFTVRVHNLAARQSQGAPNAQQRDLSGIATRDLMARVLQRDLRKMCSGLKRFTVVLDRSGFKLRPGMPFKVSDPRRGIEQVVLRAIEIADQSFRDGKITIKCMEDVFGLPDTSYVTVDDSSWTPPTTEAVPASAQAIYEANYRDVLRRAGSSNTDTLSRAMRCSASSRCRRTRPCISSTSILERGRASRTTRARAAASPAQRRSSTTSRSCRRRSKSPARPFARTLEGRHRHRQRADGTVTYDDVTHMVTVKRGVGDTVPRPHAAAATLWTIDDDFASDARTYLSGESVEALVLTRTSSDCWIRQTPP